MSKKNTLSLDGSAEQRFVRLFIQKNRRDRLLHELTTSDKRYDGISRFCHQAKDLLDPAKIVMEGEDLERRPEFECFVRQHDELCYVLSLELAPNGAFLFLRDAINQAIFCFDAVLIIGTTFSIVFGEVEKGGRGKYLLSESGLAVSPSFQITVL